MLGALVSVAEGFPDGTSGACKVTLGEDAGTPDG